MGQSCKIEISVWQSYVDLTRFVRNLNTFRLNCITHSMNTKTFKWNALRLALE